MSGYPSRRPVSPLGGYYDTREIRPSPYESRRDTENLMRYGTIRRTNGPPTSHPAERAYPEFGRVRRYEENYGSAGTDLSSYAGGSSSSSYVGGLAQMSTRDRTPYTTSSRGPPPQGMPTGPLPSRSSSHRSHRSSPRDQSPMVDISTLAGDYRPFDGFATRPPPREYGVDELDLLDTAATRRRHASPIRRSPRPSTSGSFLPTPDEFAAMSTSRGTSQYPPSLQPGYERLPPW